MKTSYTVITCQGINGRFVCPEQPLFCNARIPWQGLGKLQDSGFLFGVNMKEIPLTQGKVAIVDDCDFEELNKHKWHAVKDKSGYYASRTFGRRLFIKSTTMHAEIIQRPPGMVIDHINRNGLDNRRENLRVCTPKQNSMNSGKQINNTSGYIGVVIDRSCKPPRWRAMIGVDRKRVHIGNFATPTEAAKAYDKKALELFGEFSNLNFPAAALRAQAGKETK